jgi:DNA-binding NtrC family response regulator
MSEIVTRSTTSVSTLPRLVAGQLRIIDGPERGLVRRVETAVVIGSDPSCDLVLRDETASRRHCSVSLGPRGFLVRDLGSRNGTVFEGAHVREVAVPPGAILRVGRTHLALSVPGDSTGMEPSDRRQFGRLVGDSLAMRVLFAWLERAAEVDTTVLLGGETGTGKDLAARSLHEQGRRAGGPFEVFDCGAIAPGLVAAELFGHVRGAFSGATSNRAGLFERAHGGTIFFDEIAELPLDLQAAFLRVCEARTVTRLGSTSPVPVDVRIIGASLRDLAAEVVAGRFREDLYYRLQVLPITVPPLRERRVDLPLLCRDLLTELGVPDPGPIGGPNLERLAAHSWPGNVRELRNILEAALARAKALVRFSELPIEIEGAPPVPAAAPDGSFQELKKEAVARFEREYLAELLRNHDGNVRRAARASGIERMQLKRLLRKHGLA